jgi:hypothetical protein
MLGGVDVVVWLWTTKSVPLIVPASCVLRLASRSSQIQNVFALRVLVRRSSQTPKHFLPSGRPVFPLVYTARIPRLVI